MKESNQSGARRRILVLSVAYLPHIGGAEIALREITKRLSQFDFDIVTLALGSGDSVFEEHGNVKIYRIGRRFPRSWKINKLMFPFAAARAAARMHRRTRYDLSWSIMANYAGFAARIFKKKYPDVPLLLTLQEGDPIETILHKTRHVSGWFRDIFLRADAIQAISSYLAEFGKSMGATCPIVVVPNGVDYDQFHTAPDPHIVQALRERFTDSANDSIVITISRLVRKNAVDVLIDAVGRLSGAITLLVIGTGSELEALEARAKQLPTNVRALFLGDIPHEKLSAYLRASDVFVRPSRTEGMGNVFIEAMAAGIPVIATNAGGIADFIRDGENGLVVRIDDPSDVAEKIMSILGDAALRDRLVVGGDMTAREHDWNDISRDMGDIFEELIA